MEKLDIPTVPDRTSGRMRTYLAPLFLRVQCPSCTKHYRIDTRGLHSAEPQFECVVCLATFSLQYPNPNPLNVEAKLLKASLKPLDKKAAKTRPTDVKSCPKCSALNAKGSKECRQCGVILSRLEGLPMDMRLGALPSLVRAWQELMKDYENIKRHLAFVDRCEDLHAIPYALRKYEDLKNALPQDPLPSQMMYRMMGGIPKRATFQTVYQQSPFSRVNWQRLARVSLWMISLILITLGMSTPGFRNLAGIGASVLFVNLGLRLFLNGRLRVSDFW